MKKVYLISSGEYSGYEVNLVSEDLELARKYCALVEPFSNSVYSEENVEETPKIMLTETSDLEMHILYTLEYGFQFWPPKWAKFERQEPVFKWDEAFNKKTEVKRFAWTRDYTYRAGSCPGKYAQEVWSTLYNLIVTGTNFEEVHKIFGEQETILSNRLLEIGEQPALEWT